MCVVQLEIAECHMGLLLPHGGERDECAGRHIPRRQRQAATTPTPTTPISYPFGGLGTAPMLIFFLLSLLWIQVDWAGCSWASHSRTWGDSGNPEEKHLSS